jgi:hypothetical protein
LLEKDSVASSTGFVPLFLDKSGSQIIDPEPTMKLLKKGAGIGKSHIIYAKKHSARQAFTHVEHKHIGKIIR